jgi:hypothetical protein
VGGRGAFPRLRPTAVRRRTDPKLTFALAIVSPQDVAKLLRVIPRSPYFSLAEGKEYPSGSTEWSPRELGTRVSPASMAFFCTFLTFLRFGRPGGLVGQLKHERAERRDLEFFMDILVKYNHSLPTVPLFPRWPL